MTRLFFDYETRSEADLKKVGAAEYARHPSTRILCVAWKLDEGPVRSWSPAFPSSYGELISALCNPNVQLVAHNAGFEQAITRYVLSKIVHRPELKAIPISRWTCTASLARALALPGSLEGACAALGMPVQKDMDGRKLVMKYCKPRKATKKDGTTSAVLWHQNAADLKRIMAYCETDVVAMAAIYKALPPLHPTERQVWELDQKINTRGFLVDRMAVKICLQLIERETHALDMETATLTDGAVNSARQAAAVGEWLASDGAPLPDLTAKTVRDRLAAGGLTVAAQRLLEIRQAVSKSSTAKYLSFEARSRSDGHLRDNLIYHGAGPGRWTGSGIQPQNFPRGHVKNTAQAIDVIMTGDLELIRLIYGDVMGVLASCLRGMIVAPEGRSLFCADFAAIEARVIFWLARHAEGIEAFRAGRPMYEEMAAEIYGVPLIQVTKEQREMGKRAILGCGYQMGADEFQSSCWEQYDLKVSDDDARKAVTAYRETHAPVVQLWSNLEKAAIYAVRENKRVKVNRVVWYVQDKFLFCELPSGRRIAYYGPEIHMVRRRDKKTLEPYGDPLPKLHHWGVNPVTRKWAREGTYGGKLAENVTQGVARDLMAAAMLRIDGGHEITLTVHDEILAEGAPEKTAADFEKLMATLPIWADGLPVKVAGWKGQRYRK